MHTKAMKRGVPRILQSHWGDMVVIFNKVCPWINIRFRQYIDLVVKDYYEQLWPQRYQSHGHRLRKLIPSFNVVASSYLLLCK